MSYMTAPQSHRPSPGGSDPLSRVLGFITTVVMAVLLGIQYWNPNKRVIPVVVLTRDP